MVIASAPAEVIRLSQAVEDWLLWLRVEGRTPATLRNYRPQVEAFVKEHGDADMASVTALDVLRHLEAMKQRGCSPHTVKSRYRTLSAFFSWAVGYYDLSANPFGKLRPPKAPRHPKPFLKREQVQALLKAHASDHIYAVRFRAMVWLLMTTGMRLSELAGLTRSCLDWQAQTVTIFNGKGQRSRMVPFHPEAQRAVLRYLAKRKDDKPALWMGNKQKPMQPVAVQHFMYDAFKRVGIEMRDAMHVWRRTWAAQTQRQGIPRHYATSVGGWTTTTMLDLYTAWMGYEEEEAREAVRGMEPLA